MDIKTLKLLLELGKFSYEEGDKCYKRHGDDVVWKITDEISRIIVNAIGLGDTYFYAVFDDYCRGAYTLDEVVQYVKENVSKCKGTELVLVEDKGDQTNNGKDLHMSICKELNDIYVRKNADYGNSFGEQFQEHGLVSAVIRLDDKMRRLKSLSKQDAQVKDESIEDTLLDLCNYSLMTVMELRKKAGKS